jgi:hypothetical protein
MKCIKNAKGEIRRVENDQAEGLIGKGWNYCPKSEWKAKGAKVQAETDTTVTLALKKAKKVKKTKEERATERKLKLAEKAGVPTES